MKLPVEITFRNMGPSEALETNIREKVSKLEQFCDQIVSCRVIVDSHHKHQHKGHLFHVRIDIGVPGQEMVVSRDPPQDHSHEDAYVAVRDAFNAARRQLERYQKTNRRGSKVHAHGNGNPDGRVSELEPARDFGRITTSEGREIYFHRNSLVNGNFDKLELGTKVRFNETMGDEGPQASSVLLV